MKILWHSVRPDIPSGYGVTGKVFIPAIQSLGHEVAVACTVGNQAYTDVNMLGVACYPVGRHTSLSGNDVLYQHHKHFGSDLVISCLDLYAIDISVVKQFTWAPMCMVDSSPLMHLNIPYLRDAANYPISVTNWGKIVMEKAGFKTSYVPLAVDGKVFYQMPNKGDAREEISESWHRPIDSDTFIAVVTAANCGIPGRKNFPEIIQAWGKFNRDVSNSLLYIHTEAVGVFQRGQDLEQICDLYEVNKESVILPPQWEYITGLIGQPYMNAVYNAANVLINASLGEGFGLPAIEAQMAGCPVLLTNWGGDREHLFGGRHLEGRVEYYTQGTEYMHVLSDEILNKLRSIHMFSHGEPKTNHIPIPDMIKRAKEFEIDNVKEKYLKPFLEKVESELK